MQLDEASRQREAEPGSLLLARVVAADLPEFLEHGFLISLRNPHAGVRDRYPDDALVLARAHVDANELDKAAASLKSVMDTASDDEVALIARIRLARVQAAQGKYDEALATLKIDGPGEFDTRIADARGDVLLAKGDRAGALREYLAAREGENKGRLDVELLDMKIRDLGGTPPVTAEESS